MMSTWVHLRRGVSVDPTALDEAQSTIRPRLAEKLGHKVDRVLFWVFFAGLAWVPFWKGSNDILTWGINAVIFPGLVVVYEVSLLTTGERHPLSIKELRIPVALFVAVVLWIGFQNATWTPSFLHHPIWRMAGDALERPIAGSISVNRDLTTLAFVRLVTAASVFWIAAQLCRDPSRAVRLIYSIAIIITLYAGYGLISFAVTPGYVLWLPSKYALGYVTSTFINHNSFATYAGIGFLAICGLVLRFYRQEGAIRGGSVRFRMASLIEATGQKRGALLLGSALVVLVALLFSGSRGGIIATGLGLFAFSMLVLARRRRGLAEQLPIIFVGACLVAVTLFTFGDVFLGKLAERGLLDEGRMSVYLITLRSILDAPLLGYGYGTFIDVFPMVRDRSVSAFGLWEHAHNTYLEIFQGLGLVFGAMLVASVIFLVEKCVRGAMTRQSGVTVPCVAASTAILVGVHALADFSLEMQAVALTFMALVGAGVAQSKTARLALSD